MSDNSNRILLFSTSFKPLIGGSEMAIEEIARRLPKFNFDLITLRHKRRLKSVKNFDNIRVFRVGWGWPGDKLLFPIFGFFAARRLIGANSYLAVHAYQASQAAGAAWLLKIFIPRIKFILTLQEGKDLSAQGFLINFFRNLIIRKADVITAISNYLKDYAGKINRKTKIFLIPNGVDLDKFSKEVSYGELSALADKLGIKPGEKVIISVSRLVPKNGLGTLIDSINILTTNYKLQTINYKLVLIGDGPEREGLQLKTRNYKLETKIIFVGSISHDELAKYLRISDVFVRPSRSEGLGSAFLEAMAAGVPIIGTKVGGIPDFLKNKETGLFAEIDNPQDLAEKIGLIFSNKNLTEKIMENAKKLVTEKYNWDNIARQFEELYGSPNQ